MKTITVLVLCSFIAHAGLIAFENPPASAAPRWAQEPSLAQRSLQKIVENTDVTNLLVFIDNSAASLSPARLVDLAIYIVKADNFTEEQKEQLIDYLAGKAKKVAKNTVETNLIEAMNSAIKIQELESADESLFDRIVSNHLNKRLPGLELFIPHLDLNQQSSLGNAVEIASKSYIPLPIRAQLWKSILRVDPNHVWGLAQMVYDWHASPEALPLLNSLLQEFRALLNRPFEFGGRVYTALDWLVTKVNDGNGRSSPAQKAQLDRAVKLLRAYGAKTLQELEEQERIHMSEQDISVRDTPGKK